MTEFAVRREKIPRYSRSATRDIRGAYLQDTQGTNALQPATQDFRVFAKWSPSQSLTTKRGSWYKSFAGFANPG